MLKLSRTTQDHGPIGGTLSLPFEMRQKSRFRAQLDSGEGVAVFVPRGGILRDGDFLMSDSGALIRICAAQEPVSTAVTDDPLLFARACYHLGNRHVPLQIGDGWVRYLRDHVLDDMVLQLGLAVKEEAAPFEPEAGAYAHGQGGATARGHHHHEHHDHHHHVHAEEAVCG